MKLEPSKPALKLILIVLVLLTLASAAALGMAISRGVRSNNWLSVPAVVAERPVGLGNRSRSNSIRWRTVKVKYTFDGRKLQRNVSLFSSFDMAEEGTNLTVYVNPDRPSELASEKGFVACDYAIPMSCTIGSLAFLIVLLCIMFSPTDDYDSEVNQGLM